jgi:NADH-quinone oxidoreductase subunit J
MPERLNAATGGSNAVAGVIGFWIVAVVSVVTGVLVIFQRNPVRCALFLILNFGSLAVLYLLLNAQLLAALQVLVYAGAIMVLFLFVIMLLNLGGEQVEHDPLVAQRPLALAIGAALLVGLSSTFYGWAQRSQGAGGAGISGAGAAVAGASAGQDQVSEIGRQLFVHYVYPFEVTSLLLLVGIIGTVLLGKRRI